MLKRLFYSLLVVLSCVSITSKLNAQGMTINIEYNPIHSQSHLGGLRLSEWATGLSYELRMSTSLCFIVGARFSMWDTGLPKIDFRNKPFFMFGANLGMRLFPDARSRIKIVTFIGFDRNLSKDLLQYDGNKRVLMEMPSANAYALGGLELYITNKICIRPQVKANIMMFMPPKMNSDNSKIFGTGMYDFYSYGVSINLTI